MLVDEDELYPTWLSVPQFATRVEKVYAEFRIIGAAKKNRTGFSGGDGGPPLIVWAFYSLLERFLKLGPVPPQQIEEIKGTEETRKTRDRDITIQVLELDFRMPDNPRLAEDDKRRTSSRLDNADRKVMNARYLAEYIRREIRGMSDVPGAESPKESQLLPRRESWQHACFARLPTCLESK